MENVPKRTLVWTHACGQLLATDFIEREDEENEKVDYEPDWADAYRWDENDESSVVSLSHTIVHPLAMVIKNVHASVAVSAVLGAITNIWLTNIAVVLELICFFHLHTFLFSDALKTYVLICWVDHGRIATCPTDDKGQGDVDKEIYKSVAPVGQESIVPTHNRDLNQKIDAKDNPGYDLLGMPAPLQPALSDPLLDDLGLILFDLLLWVMVVSAHQVVKVT